MKRRTLLHAAAVGGTGLLAACVDAPGDNAEDRPHTDPTTESRSPTETGTPSGTESPTERDDGTADMDHGTPNLDDGSSTETETEPETEASRSNGMTSRSFEVLNVGCGSEAPTATVERGEDRVAVDGTIQGQNGCYTADQKEVHYDDGSDELTVDVRSYEGGGEGCTKCIVDVDYRASFEFRDGTPEEVHVWHDGDHVTTG